MDRPSWWSAAWARRSLALVGELLFVALGIALWLAVFLIGTLVDSAPYRARFAAFEGGFGGTIESGVLVLCTYTLTNVAILCLLACLLGASAAQAQLGADAEREADQDHTAPRRSALLRGFLVYLCLLAGVLVFGEDPVVATQKQYVRLAGFISLLGFLLSYRPQLFGRLLRRAGALIDGSRGEGDPKPEPREQGPR